MGDLMKRVKNLRVLKGTDGDVLNGVPKGKLNKKPRFYIEVCSLNRYVIVSKIISNGDKDKIKLSNKYFRGFRKDLGEVLDNKSNIASRKFINSSVDKTLYYLKNGEYLSKKIFKDIDIYFDKKDSVVILQFLLSDEDNRKHFIDFITNNGTDEEIKFYMNYLK